ncbi:DUF1080 domain-containing protein [Neolewinella aurantiaca]|uniref:DUF1080 domain-containing protein n=2 Tax=Neolewinella aurantiaca TaxID=2602767 RepID=A0A5C7FLD3_9BACT|nr:DUF1080 domain-containing protein [Neolewinella aurantiaca]
MSCGNSDVNSTNLEEPVGADAVAENWIPLFNGKDLEGWDIKIAGKDVNDNFQNTFVWEDDMLRIKYDEYDEFEDLFGHIYYKIPYSYYKLRFDYRFTGEQTPGGSSWNVRNSGVMLHSQSAASNEYGQHFPVSVELQLLGGLNDGKPRTTANVCTPGTTVMMGDTLNNRHCISSSSETYDGDQWVHAEAVVLGGEAMHFLIEGDTVLSFQNPQLGGGNAKQLRKWGLGKAADKWIARDGEILTKGYIALQAESHPIDFRNVELLKLPEQ